jgi:hypothetical protein
MEDEGRREVALAKKRRRKAESGGRDGSVWGVEGEITERRGDRERGHLSVLLWSTISACEREKGKDRIGLERYSGKE